MCSANKTQVLSLEFRDFPFREGGEGVDSNSRRLLHLTRFQDGGTRPDYATSPRFNKRYLIAIPHR